MLVLFVQVVYGEKYRGYNFGICITKNNKSDN